MSGCFVAEQNCEAGRSVRDPDNPGQLRLEAGHPTGSWAGTNALRATFQVVVPGADPDQRWVDARCGRVVDDCGTGTEPAVSGPVPPPSHAQNLLAVSWQPAFCESHPGKRECARQTGALAFTLHGLWPQPETLAYCDVDATEAAIDRRGRWDLLPAVEVDEATRAALDQAMPGAQSMLDRHEWIKHGTCYSRTAEEYFDEALRLLAELNASVVRELVVSRIGRTVRLDEVRASFDSRIRPRRRQACGHGLRSGRPPHAGDRTEPEPLGRDHRRYRARRPLRHGAGSRRELPRGRDRSAGMKPAEPRRSALLGLSAAERDRTR